jgi:hypothetical protein
MEPHQSVTLEETHMTEETAKQLLELAALLGVTDEEIQTPVLDVNTYQNARLGLAPGDCWAEVGQRRCIGD